MQDEVIEARHRSNTGGRCRVVGDSAHDFYWASNRCVRPTHGLSARMEGDGIWSHMPSGVRFMFPDLNAQHSWATNRYFVSHLPK
jgi:hypothetical protein